LEKIVSAGLSALEEKAPEGFAQLKQSDENIMFGSLKGNPAEFLYYESAGPLVRYRIPSKTDYTKLKKEITANYKLDKQQYERDGKKYALYYNDRFTIMLDWNDNPDGSYYETMVIKNP